MTFGTKYSDFVRVAYVHNRTRPIGNFHRGSLCKVIRCPLGKFSPIFIIASLRLAS